MDGIQILLLAVFLIMSLSGFATMWIDKRRAIAGAWRIKERTLFAIAFFFGGVGSLIGMWTFRHKTKHWYFVVGIPLLACLNVAVLTLGMIFL